MLPSPCSTLSLPHRELSSKDEHANIRNKLSIAVTHIATCPRLLWLGRGAGEELATEGGQGAACGSLAGRIVPGSSATPAKSIFERLRDEYGFDGKYTILNAMVKSGQPWSSPVITP